MSNKGNALWSNHCRDKPSEEYYVVHKNNTVDFGMNRDDITQHIRDGFGTDYKQKGPGTHIRLERKQYMTILFNIRTGYIITKASEGNP